MAFLASIFVGKPQHILTVAVVFLAGYLVVRFTPIGNEHHPRPLLVGFTVWGLYAIWEWLVQTKTPEANIRVDLLVIFPLLAILSGWALYRSLR